jgi:U3 small nucleolar RNA-associated protein 18
MTRQKKGRTKEDKQKSKAASKALVSSGSKPPAWVDPADTHLTKVSLLNGHSRLRKLRQAATEDEITGREYETRLRNQFERINPEPVWARKARGVGKRKKGKAKEGDRESDESERGADDIEEEGDGIQDLLASTTGLLAERRKHGKQSVVLRREELAIERVRDANHSAQSPTSGEVRVVSFHPKPAVPVLCVATADRRVRLFHVRCYFSDFCFLS